MASEVIKVRKQSRRRADGSIGLVYEISSVSVSHCEMEEMEELNFLFHANLSTIQVNSVLAKWKHKKINWAQATPVLKG